MFVESSSTHSQIINIVPENQAWQLMIKCREIGEILMSDSIPKSKIQCLPGLLNWWAPSTIPSPFTCRYDTKVVLSDPLSLHDQFFWSPSTLVDNEIWSQTPVLQGSGKKTEKLQNLLNSLATRCQTPQAVSLSSSFFQLSEMHCGRGETIPVSAFDQSVCDGMKEISGLGNFEGRNRLQWLLGAAEWHTVWNGVFAYNKHCSKRYPIIFEDWMDC